LEGERYSIMAIKYLNAKRIRGSSTGAKTTAEFSETFSSTGHTSDGTTVNGWTSDDISVLRYEGQSGTGLTGVANFDGDDKVTLGGSASDYNFLTTGFSIAFWVKPDAIANNNTVFDSTNGSASANGLVIRWEDSEKKIRLMIGSSGSGGGNIISDGNEMVLNEWQHLAFTYDGTTARIYRNGTEIKNGSITSHTGTSANVPAIGDCVSGGDSGYDGAIQDFVITNDTLTTGEITSLANGSVASALGSSGNNQKIHYPLTANFNDAVSSGGLGNGTASGNAVINTTTKGKQGDNLHFNITGTNDTMYYDLQQAGGLGANANATKWTLRFKVNMVTKAGSTSNGTQFVLGASSGTANANRDFMGILILQSHSSAGNRVVNATVNNGQPQNQGTSGNYLGGASQSIELTSGTDWWVDITRDGDDCTTTIYEDEFTGTSYTKTITASNVADLRYLLFANYSGEATFVGNVDDIEFYDGGMTQDEKATLLTSLYPDGFGSSADGTLTGVTLNESVEKLGTGCLDFAGGGSDDLETGSVQLLPTGTSDYTLSLWVRFDTLSGGQELLRGGSSEEVEINYSNGNGIYFTRNGGNTQIVSAGNLAVDTWYNVVIKNDGGTTYGYLNYDAYTANATAKSLSSGTTWRFGGRDSSSESLNGKMDDIAVWHRALSDSERSSLYNSGTGAVASSISQTSLKYYMNCDVADGKNDAVTSNTSDLPENSVFEEIDTRVYYFLQSNEWKNTFAQQYGYILAGRSGGSNSDDVSRYAMSSSTTGTKVGDLSSNNNGGGGCENNDCSQMFLQYHHNGSSYVKNIKKVIPSTSVTVSDHGNTVTNGVDGDGCSSTTHGYRAGGNTGGAYTNAIEKFAFSSNTNGTDVGNMFYQGQHGGAIEDKTNGYGYHWGLYQ